MGLLHTMRDYVKFRKVVEKIETGACDKWCECYEEKLPPLVYPSGPDASTVLISESPWDLPSTKHVSITGNKEDLDRSLNSALTEGELHAPIHEFIIRSFQPLFEGETRDLATRFLDAVYWTHVGKKSFKAPRWRKSTERFSAGRKCATNLLIEEISAVEPSLLITLSSIATQVLLGHSFMELLERHRGIGGELLEIRDVIEDRRESLLARALFSSPAVFSPDWKCQLAVLPNPSCTAKRWQREAMKGGVMQAIERRIGDRVKSRVASSR